MGLPDRKGDVLVREIRSVYPSMPVVVASGQGKGELRRIFKGMPLMAFAGKPYTADDLLAALRAVGIVV